MAWGTETKRWSWTESLQDEGNGQPPAMQQPSTEIFESLVGRGATEIGEMLWDQMTRVNLVQSFIWTEMSRDIFGYDCGISALGLTVTPEMCGIIGEYFKHLRDRIDSGHLSQSEYQHLKAHNCLLLSPPPPRDASSSSSDPNQPPHPAAAAPDRARRPARVAAAAVRGRRVPARRLVRRLRRAAAVRGRRGGAAGLLARLVRRRDGFGGGGDVRPSRPRQRAAVASRRARLRRGRDGRGRARRGRRAWQCRQRARVRACEAAQQERRREGGRR